MKQRQFFQACADGNLQAVQKGLRPAGKVAKLFNNTPININAYDDNDRDELTALMKAASNGHFAVVQLLIENGADVNSMSCALTALMLAAESGYESIVSLLIASGADVNAGAPHETPLLFAVENGHAAIVQQLIVAGADVNVSYTFSGGYSALHRAAFAGDSEIVRLLVAAGADVDAKSKDTNSVILIDAAMMGHLGVVQLLVDAGVDIYCVDGSRKSAIEAARLKGHDQIVALLAKNGADVKLFFAAVDDGDFAIVRNFIELGINVDIADMYGMTALMLAAACRNTKLIQLLLSEGADVNIIKPDLGYVGEGAIGYTALNFAIDAGCLDGVKTLVAHGANIQVKVDGMTTIELAEYGGNIEIADFLAACGVNSQEDVDLELGDTECPVKKLRQHADEEELRSWNILRDFDSKTAYKKMPDYDVAYIRAAGPLESAGTPGNWDNELLLLGLQKAKLKSRLLFHLAADNIFKNNEIESFIYAIQAFNAAKSLPEGAGPHVYTFFYLYYLFLNMESTDSDNTVTELIAMNSPGIEISSIEDHSIEFLARKAVKTIEISWLKEGEKVIREKFKVKEQEFAFPATY